MIYLDYQATTPLAPEAAAAMHPWIETNFGNPHSPHRFGREAAAAIEVARGRVVEALHSFGSSRAKSRGACDESEQEELTSPRSSRAKSRGAGTESERAPLDAVYPERLPQADSRRARDERGGVPGRIYFTSGATEAANWALKGAAARLPPNRRRIVTLATEHACVLDTVAWLGQQGFETEILPVGSDGIVNLDLLSSRIDHRTGLVAAMLVNNEVGVVQPIGEIGRIARTAGALFFCDAVQGFGRVPLPLDTCDFVAVSAHKVHGPKGIGALWIREGAEIDPLLHGGGQEGGIRSGTLSPALCVAFGEAARLLSERGEADTEHVGRLWHTALSALGDRWTLNGSAEQRYLGNLNIRGDGIDAARLISELRGLAFSAGSACASGSGRPSHVLSALGLAEREARSSIRLGFGRYTTEDDLVRALTLIEDAAARQRSFAA